jgi:hypothetical protein
MQAISVAPRRQTKRDIDKILARREQLMLEELHGMDVSSTFVANARQLLTRSWSRATWKTREELLKNVEWLVRLERRRDRLMPDPE